MLSDVERSKFNNMNKRAKQIIIVSILSLVVVIIAIIAVVLTKNKPSKVVKELKDYYLVSENEVMIFMQDEIYEKRGLIMDGSVYIDYDTVVTYFNKRFYWDANENVLIYTTPTEVIRTEVGNRDYYVNESKSTLPYQIVKTNGQEVYIALDYVKMHSNIEYEMFTEPNRMVIQYKWGEEFLYNIVKKETQIREEANIKSDILKELSIGDKLLYLDFDDGVKKGFCKVMSEDGVIGYVKEKHMGEANYESLTSNYQEPVYTHISKDYKINMVWHQVMNMDANASILDKLATTKGVTTISPTWFSIISVEGEISSLASETYVEKAKGTGVEVWALCDDFNKEVDMYQLLSHTSRRKKLINELVAAAIKYDLAGLNIDFERITESSAPHYIQFLRELSVKCRNNGIILSVDNYVPSVYTEYYDRKEQGILVDYVVTMAYDEHYAGSEESGSVSSIGFVEKAVNDILTMVPAEQVIIGIPFYTRLWTEKVVDGEVAISSSACSMSSGLEYLSVHGIEPEWNEETGQYYGEYEQDGAKYRIWLEEDRSIELKLKTIFEKNVAGVSGWKLGLEKESIWNLIIKYTN